MPVDQSQSPAAVLKNLCLSGCAIVQGSHSSPALQNAALLSQKPVERIDLHSHQSVVQYVREDQVVSVQTGILLSELAQLLEESNQQFPCFGLEKTTLLDVINCGDAGYFEQGYGGVRALVLGLEVALSDGKVIKTGGKVVKNVTGYDLTKLFVGARGTLGLPILAHLRLYAKAEESTTLVFLSANFSGLLDAASRLIRTGLPITGLDMLLNGDPQLEPLFLEMLPNTVFNADSNSALIVNLAEHKSVVAELLPRVASYCELMASDTVKLDNHQANELFRGIESTFANSEWQLQSPLPQPIVKNILPDLIESDVRFVLHYRPLSGRCRFSCQSDSSLTKIVKAIGRQATEQAPLTVAYPDAGREYHLHRLPSEDPQIQQIKKNLKQWFDPSGCLNPFAVL